MRKNNETFDDVKRRLQELSGIKPLNESRKSTPTTISPETVIKGKDNVSYAIVKEEGSYYIKTTTADLINESTLDYIGGIKNKHNYKYKYDSFSHATRNLNYMMIELNESLGSDKDLIDERLEKDMGQEPAPAPGEGSGLPQEQPAPMPEPQGQPAPQADAPMPAEEPAPEAPMDAPAPEADQTGLAPDDSDLEEPEDDSADIDHYVGKLTSIIRNTGQDQMNPDKVKSILNSIISALPLNIVSAEERLVMARRVKTASTSKDKQNDPEQPMDVPAPEGEEPVEEITIPMDEIITPLEKPTSQFKTPHDFDKKDDLKMNEFFANIQNGDFVSENNQIKYKNVLIEASENTLILKNESNSFKFNVSEDTIKKFKLLIK